MLQGQFNVPGNTRVEVEFPCPKCGRKLKGKFKIKPAPHSDETVYCPYCDVDYDVTVTHDDGTGIIQVHAIDDQRAVNAEGLS